MRELTGYNQRWDFGIGEPGLRLITMDQVRRHKMHSKNIYSLRYSVNKLDSSIFLVELLLHCTKAQSISRHNTLCMRIGNQLRHNNSAPTLEAEMYSDDALSTQRSERAVKCTLT